MKWYIKYLACNNKDYHKRESWHFCLPIDGVASLHLALVYLHCNVDRFGQFSCPRANLTHQAEEQHNKTSVTAAMPTTTESHC